MCRGGGGAALIMIWGENLAFLPFWGSQGLCLPVGLLELSRISIALTASQGAALLAHRYEIRIYARCSQTSCSSGEGARNAR